MHPRLLDILACPDCGGDLTVAGSEAVEGDDIVEGRLACTDCRRETPVRRGIPRFVADEQDDYENFSYQWRRWGRVQIDRFAGHHLSEDRFRRETGWDADWLRGKLVLDGGSGAGRFADVAAGFGAEVVALDISGAIDACRENLACHGARVHPVQASLLALPLRPAAFDAVYCMGVIQHTPDPKGVVARLITRVRPGGRLAVNFYERDWWPKLQPIKYGLRLFTPSLRASTLLALCRGLVAVLFPLTRILSRIPKLRIVNHVIPICSVHDPALTPEQQRIWTLLDTFDWYGPRYERRQKHDELAALLAAAEMRDVEARPGLVRATRPAAP